MFLVYCHVYKNVVFLVMQEHFQRNRDCGRSIQSNLPMLSRAVSRSQAACTTQLLFQTTGQQGVCLGKESEMFWFAQTAVRACRLQLYSLQLNVAVCSSSRQYLKLSS